MPDINIEQYRVCYTVYVHQVRYNVNVGNKFDAHEHIYAYSLR